MPTPHRSCKVLTRQDAARMQSETAEAVAILRDPDATLPDDVRGRVRAIATGRWRGLNYAAELRPDAVAVLGWDDMRREAGTVSDPGESLT